MWITPPSVATPTTHNPQPPVDNQGMQWITCMHNHLPTGYPQPTHRDIHRDTHMTRSTGED